MEEKYWAVFNWELYEYSLYPSDQCGSIEFASLSEAWRYYKDHRKTCEKPRSLVVDTKLQEILF